MQLPLRTPTVVELSPQREEGVRVRRTPLEKNPLVGWARRPPQNFNVRRLPVTIFFFFFFLILRLSRNANKTLADTAAMEGFVDIRSNNARKSVFFFFLLKLSDNEHCSALHCFLSRVKARVG